MKLQTLGVLVLAFIAFASTANAQTRKSVSATEVNGTFRDESGSQFKILAIGGGKLKIAFDGVYPYKLAKGVSVNVGEADGTAEINGDTATFVPDYAAQENMPCKITLKFVRAGKISVNQEGNDVDCGFGHNVSATGNYSKTSGKKPNFKRAMIRIINLCGALALMILFCSSLTSAQTANIDSSQINGTFRDRNGSEFKLLSLDGGKVKMQFHGVYKWKNPKGRIIAHSGGASGETELNADTLKFVIKPLEGDDAFSGCELYLKFSEKDKITVKQNGFNCGFGQRVYAGGDYKKISNDKPTFDY